jgi:transcriptional regulator with XRE-family HTH domain
MPPFPPLVRSPDALKAARQALHLSADGLAQMLRVEDGRSVRRWEAGDSAIPGPVTVILETAMGYLNKRDMIAQQLEMLLSGKMHTSTSSGVALVDDTPETIARLKEADADYKAALETLTGALETLTRRPSEDAAAREVHWYHLWRQTPKFDPPEKDEWSVPGELSPEAALAYFEKHEGFSEGLILCDDPDDLSAEFMLEQRELHRIPRGVAMSLRPGKPLRRFAVKRLN